MESRREAVFIDASALNPKLYGRVKPLLKEYSDGMSRIIAPLFPRLPEELQYDIGNLLLAVSDSFLIDGDRDRGIRMALFAMKLFTNYIGGA